MKTKLCLVGIVLWSLALVSVCRADGSETWSIYVTNGQPSTLSLGLSHDTGTEPEGGWWTVDGGASDTSPSVNWSEDGNIVWLSIGDGWISPHDVTAVAASDHLTFNSPDDMHWADHFVTSVPEPNPAAVILLGFGVGFGWFGFGWILNLVRQAGRHTQEV